MKLIVLMAALVACAFCATHTPVPDGVRSGAVEPANSASVYVRGWVTNPETQQLQRGQGSGTLVAADGKLFVVTAYHVTRHMGTLEVVCPSCADGSARAVVVTFAPATDHALLEVINPPNSMVEAALDWGSLAPASPPLGQNVSLVTYNQGKINGQGFAVETVPQPLSAKLLVESAALPGETVPVDVIILKGREFVPGQSGALVYYQGQPLGVVYAPSTQATFRRNGVVVKVLPKGTLLIPFSAIRRDMALFFQYQQPAAPAPSTRAAVAAVDNP